MQRFPRHAVSELAFVVRIVFGQSNLYLHRIFDRKLSVARRSAALILSIALVSQIFPGGQVRTVSAHPATPLASAPISAPPEAFTIGQPVAAAETFIGLASSIGTSVLGLFAAPGMPEGLTIPNPSAKAVEPMPPPAPPAGSTTFDFDGDGKADIGRWHSANTEFKVKNSGSNNYTSTTIGSSSSIPAPVDFDGDGKTDAAVFNAGTWNIKQSSNGVVINITGFGQAGDIPVPGDWVGSSAVDEAVYRPSNGTWYFRDGANGNLTSQQFGAAGDIPVPGNYDGDSKLDVAVFRTSTGDWYLNQSTGGFATFHWGLPSDVPFGVDFDGDGKSDPGVYRPGSGMWYVLKSSTNLSTYIAQGWGNYGDQPVPADYDGDGKADFAVWRPTTGVWHIIKSSDNTYDYQTLGVAGDRAIPSSFIKQTGYPVAGSAMAKLRLSPKNATGGTDLYSQNFAWGTSLVGLPGRAGLNAGFGMGYNSLVWIKDATNNAMIFDPDTSNISPGFRFGFPTIEPAYYNADTGGWAYMMVTPSGGRIRLDGSSADPHGRLRQRQRP